MPMPLPATEEHKKHAHADHEQRKEHPSRTAQHGQHGQTVTGSGRAAGPRPVYSGRIYSSSDEAVRRLVLQDGLAGSRPTFAFR